MNRVGNSEVNPHLKKKKEHMHHKQCCQSWGSFIIKIFVLSKLWKWHTGINTWKILTQNTLWLSMTILKPYVIWVSTANNISSDK